MSRSRFLVVLSALACSPQSPHLQLQVGSGADVAEAQVPTVTMKTEEIRLIQFVAVGAGSEALTFSGAGLPSYARLDGPVLTLAPGRPDAGETVVTVTATAGAETASTSLRIVVARANRAPLWQVGHWLIGDDAPYGEHGMHHVGICPGPFCTLYGTPTLWLDVSDPDGDAIQIEVEVVARGQPFSGKATHVAVKSSDWRSQVSWNNFLFQMPLTGLTPNQSYEFAVRVTDRYGAIATSISSAPADGWLHAWGDPFQFDLAPCTTFQCACVPSGRGCEGAAQCCSGTCDPGGPLPGFLDGVCR